MQNSVNKSQRKEYKETLIEERLRDDTKVVIVGAGLAGLAAAHRLYESGVNDVIVLDALNRIGGRVHTINHLGKILELGAQWLHGADDNPLYKWLMSENMLDDFEDASVGFKGIFCTSDGQEVDPQLVKRVIDIMFEGKLSLFKNHHSDITEGDSGSKNAAEVFKHLLDLQINSDESLGRNRKLVYSIFNWFLRYETIENGCDSMDEVSMSSYTEWNDHGDGTLLNFKHGYRSLLDWFAGHIPAHEWIKLNQQVSNIELLKNDSMGNWVDESGIRYNKPIIVRVMDTGNLLNKESKTISCDHVIVTSSLGFLKKNLETFFTPQLPDVKKDLINSLGFGTVNKVILQFESPFWTQSNGIKLLWDEDDEALSEFPLWIRDIISFDVVRKQPNLLIGWIGGQGAKVLEEESDIIIGETCLRLLHKILPSNHKKPSPLISCICSRWSSNPFICGSYSFQSMQSLELNIDELQKPLYNIPQTNGSLGSSSHSLIPRILFAGEATAGKLYSTTHGAIVSGWREADRLQDYLSSNSKSEISEIDTNNNIQMRVN